MRKPSCPGALITYPLKPESSCTVTFCILPGEQLISHRIAGYAAFANNDPSVLFGALAPDVHWHQAEGNPLADRSPYVGAQGGNPGQEDVVLVGGGRTLVFDTGFNPSPTANVSWNSFTVGLGAAGWRLNNHRARIA